MRQTSNYKLITTIINYVYKRKEEEDENSTFEIEEQWS